MRVTRNADFSGEQETDTSVEFFLMPCKIAMIQLCGKSKSFNNSMAHMVQCFFSSQLTTLASTYSSSDSRVSSTCSSRVSLWFCISDIYDTSLNMFGDIQEKSLELSSRECWHLWCMCVASNIISSAHPQWQLQLLQTQNLLAIVILVAMCACCFYAAVRPVKSIKFLWLLVPY